MTINMVATIDGFQKGIRSDKRLKHAESPF